MKLYVLSFILLTSWISTLNAQPQTVRSLISEGDFATAQAVLEASPDQLSRVDERGNTLLHYIAEEGWRGSIAIDFAVWLLRCGLDIHRANEQGELAWVWASDRAMRDLLRPVESGAPVDSMELDLSGDSFWANGGGPGSDFPPRPSLGGSSGWWFMSPWNPLWEPIRRFSLKRVAPEPSNQEPAEKKARTETQESVEGPITTLPNEILDLVLSMVPQSNNAGRAELRTVNSGFRDSVDRQASFDLVVNSKNAEALRNAFAQGYLKPETIRSLNLNLWAFLADAPELAKWLEFFTDNARKFIHLNALEWQRRVFYDHFQSVSFVTKLANLVNTLPHLRCIDLAGLSDDRLRTFFTSLEESQRKKEDFHNLLLTENAFNLLKEKPDIFKRVRSFEMSFANPDSFSSLIAFLETNPDAFEGVWQARHARLPDHSFRHFLDPSSRVAQHQLLAILRFLPNAKMPDTLWFDAQFIASWNDKPEAELRRIQEIQKLTVILEGEEEAKQFVAFATGRLSALRELTLDLSGQFTRASLRAVYSALPNLVALTIKGNFAENIRVTIPPTIRDLTISKGFDSHISYAAFREVAERTKGLRRLNLDWRFRIGFNEFLQLFFKTSTIDTIDLRDLEHLETLTVEVLDRDVNEEAWRSLKHLLEGHGITFTYR